MKNRYNAGSSEDEILILNNENATHTNNRSGWRCTCSTELWKRIWIVSLYMITITILYADMNILAPNLSIIADEFGMDDDERDVKLGGLIALGFFFVGAPMSPAFDYFDCI